MRSPMQNLLRVEKISTLEAKLDIAGSTFSCATASRKYGGVIRTEIANYSLKFEFCKNSTRVFISLIESS